MFTIIGYDLNQEFPFLTNLKSDSDVEIYVDVHDYRITNAKKVYIQLEPFAIKNNLHYLLYNQPKYDAIICHDPALFQNTNAIGYCPASTWIAPSYYESVRIQDKKFQISHMSGYKEWTLGHRIRKDLYMNQLKFGSYPMVFYRSWVQPQLPDIQSNPFIPETIPTNCHYGLVRTSKAVLFTEFQFSIVIENTRETNYFSEKLVDCLIMKTIPIYYGCPNIGDFYDTRGWIILETTDCVQELLTKLSALSASYYSLYLDTIEKNYETAKTYASFTNNIRQSFLRLPFVHE